MSPTITGVDLTKVHIHCQKPKCRTKDFVLHRHHMGHEHMFVSQFVHRFSEKRYVEFVKRYYEYREEDTVKICSCHHREIHEIYDEIIAAYCRKRRKALADFNWTEARELMSLLVARCKKWMKQRTKGSKVPWPSNGRTKHKAEHFIDLLLASDEEGFTEAVEQPFTDEVPF